jgi:hypothetical protein
MKMSLFVAAVMLLTSVASAQDPKYLVPFTQGQCDDKRLVVGLGDTPIEVHEKAEEFGLKVSSEDDSSATFTNSADGRMLIVSYNDDMQVRASAYFIKCGDRNAAKMLVDSFDTLLRVFYTHKLKGTIGYYKVCDDAYLVATAKAIKVAKDWYVSVTLMGVQP